MDINGLIEQLRAGDDTAGPILVSIVAPRLLGYMATVAPDLSTADQELLAEQAIGRAVERIDQYDPARGSFEGWIRGIARRAIADWRRAHPGGVGELDENLSVGDGDPTATRAIDDMVEVRDTDTDEGSRINVALAALVLGLSETDQLIIRLRFVEQLPHTSIAERLCVRPAACRKRLQRALERLKAQAATDPDFLPFLEGGAQ